MKRKLIAMLGAVFFTLAACSQKKEEPMTTQNPQINAKNIVEKLQQEVKQYPKEPIYVITYNQGKCFFEVLVNDIPVYKDFSDTRGTSAFDINQALLKNGNQKITFRMYPANEMERNDETLNYFSKNASLTLTVEFYDKMDSNDRFGSFVKKYKTPKIPNPVSGESPDSIFVATGKEFYEESFTFEAQVPFLLQNFDKAQDLRKMDPKALEAKLLKKYKEIASFYQNRDYDQIARISFDKLKNELIALYYSKEDAQEIWETILPILSNSTLKMQPIENYELRFFAGGKLAALITKSTDPKLRGSSALWGKFKVDGKEKAFISKDFFYIPEGETEFKVY